MTPPWLNPENRFKAIIWVLHRNRIYPSEEQLAGRMGRSTLSEQERIWRDEEFERLHIDKYWESIDEF